jgi:Haem-binding domain
MKKILVYAASAGLLAFMLLQFTNPARVNPPLVAGHDLCASNGPPPEIAEMLHRACYDCHSYETKWRWYSQIAPISWTVAGDVHDGRQQLNFSEWPRDDAQRVQKRLKKISRDVESGDMPPTKYTWVHREARLSADEREKLSQWAKEGAKRVSE